MSAPATDETRARVLALLKRYGWNATSFQSLEAGFRYWFDEPGDDACVAYVETGGAWVVAGAPICPAERLGEVAQHFTEAARAAGKRCAFFAAEARLVAGAGLRAMQVGEQPVWDPTSWRATVAATASLRQQLRRAENKGVTVRPLAPAELTAPLRAQLETLIERWLHDKPMAPMGFLVDVQPFEFPEERRYFVAERGGALQGFVAAVPIYGRQGWLIEDFLRAPGAPNGTAELLIDAAMTALAAEGSRYVTLGLAPLSGPLAGWLRAARKLSAALYDFHGLRAFKAKLRPHEWEPIFVAHPVGSSSHLALLDALAAFARGSFLRFGGAALRGPALVVRLLTAALVPWTALLALAPARWFPARWVQTSWIAFDLVLIVALTALTLRWRHWLGVAAASAITADAALTTLQVALFDAARTHGADWLYVIVSLVGPALATLVLWGAVDHRRPRRPRAALPPATVPAGPASGSESGRP